MTNQELFDRVAKHLLTQNARSLWMVYPETSGCAYRGTNGEKCAIGVLIPDEKYSLELENKLVSDSSVMEAAGLELSNLSLANQLQMCHDLTSVSAWPSRLREIAEEFGLSAEILHSFGRV